MYALPPLYFIAYGIAGRAKRRTTGKGRRKEETRARRDRDGQKKTTEKDRNDRADIVAAAAATLQQLWRRQQQHNNRGRARPPSDLDSSGRDCGQTGPENLFTSLPHATTCPITCLPCLPPPPACLLCLHACSALHAFCTCLTLPSLPFPPFSSGWWLPAAAALSLDSWRQAGSCLTISSHHSSSPLLISPLLSSQTEEGRKMT